MWVVGRGGGRRVATIYSTETGPSNEEEGLDPQDIPLSEPAPENYR